MFGWNVEDMKLLNQKCNILIGKEKIYNCENEVSREEKIKFVDKMKDGKLSYILNLAQKLEKDKENMSVDQWGDVKTISLKAWIKRNDDRKLIDFTYKYGNIRFLAERNIQSVNLKGAYDTYDNYVDEIFHRQLKECEQMEHEYFLEHDEYSILKQKFRDKKYCTTFGVHINIWSNGRICVCDKNENERDITIDELKYLLGKYDELDRLVEKITAQTNIKY